MLRCHLLLIGQYWQLTLSDKLRKWWAEYKNSALFSLPLLFLRLPRRLLCHSFFSIWFLCYRWMSFYHLVNASHLCLKYLTYCGLRSKRFRLVSEQRNTEERDSRFWPREKWNKSQKMKVGGGGGEGRKRLQTNPSILKTCVRQRTQRLIGSASQTMLTCVDQRFVSYWEDGMVRDTYINFQWLLFILVGKICPPMQEHFLWPLLKPKALLATRWAVFKIPGFVCKRFLPFFPTPSPLFYLRHFSRGLWLSLLVLCS